MSSFLLYSKSNTPTSLLPLLKMPRGTVPPREGAQVVIQWGVNYFSSQDPSVHVLNGEEGLSNVSSRRTMMDMIRWNGIPTIESAPKVSTIRRYFVAVFQQEELALFRARGKKIWMNDQVSLNTDDTYEEIEINRSIREIRRVLQFAIRSIYAVGLDFGGVLIGVGINGALKVIDITPTPKLTESLAAKFSGAFDSYISELKKIPSQSVMLGADPEFVLRNKTTGKMVLASQFFSKKGRVGCDQIWIRSDQTRTQLPLAELRPLPSKDPRQLTFNLYKTMLMAERKISHTGIEWLAGGMPMKGYPIGGHIHFSGTTLNTRFLRALDNYLALPLMLLENDHSLSRRPKYGFLGDFRRQFHGGFEYRSLPSWIVSPRVTKGVFALAKLIALSYPELSYFPTLNASIQEAFYNGEKRKILNSVKNLWSNLEQLKEYENHRQFLTPFRDMVLNMEEWDEFQDIRQAWRIPPFGAKKMTTI